MFIKKVSSNPRPTCSIAARLHKYLYSSRLSSGVDTSPYVSYYLHSIDITSRMGSYQPI